jgi:hypothetical protein
MAGFPQFNLGLIKFLFDKAARLRQVRHAMKPHTLIFALSSVVATAFSGTPSPVTAPAPMAQDTLSGWFIAGSFGQLYDVGKGIDANAFNTVGLNNARTGTLDMDMYNLEIGRDLCPMGEGFGLSAYLEVSYLDGSVSVDASPYLANYFYSFGVDAQIVPVTANLKVEHQLFGPVNAYLTGGLGYAWTDFKGNNQASSDSSNGGGFYAQVTAGLIWNINPQWEMYGGARWIYLNGLDGAKIGFYNNAEIKLQDSWAWEAGIRFNF